VSSEPTFALTSQPWLEALLSGSSEGVALCGPHGLLVRTNHRLVELLDEHGPLEGRRLDELFHDPAWPLAVAAARSRGHWSGRLRAGNRELDARLRLFSDGHGALLCRDLSERLELDLRARSLAAQLETHVSRADEARSLLFEQSERLTNVYQLTLDALESATLRDTAERICETVLDDVEAENAAIWLLDHDQELLRRIAAVGRRARALPISCHRRDAPNVEAALASGAAAPQGKDGVLAGYAVFLLPGREQQRLGVMTVDHVTDLDRVQVYMPHVATGINNAILAEELVRANHQLRAIDQQKSEFLNIVAHDLRTPLTCIRTYTDLITMYVGEEPETYAEFLQIIAEETERLGELLDNFLDLARIENATIVYQLEPLRLDEIAGHFAQVYRGRSEVEGIGLVCELPDDMPVIEADRRRIEQVFSNLLSNAFKFTPPGGQVTMVTEPFAEGVRLVVSDTGPGVPADQRQRVFERFRQAQKDHAKGGSGLGLAIALAIVTHHGGRIWVDDAEGGGARFTVELPYAPPESSVARKGSPG